ncbi:Pentatricopeptide repeat-containing protein [Thalictrum thalictroides]|uniref:Pentatricopeptide repeat-containing protein n=1 Tax=Thalictrum thalictroides TaxID=46969 RepID=A0A7J6VQU9_THATH|nr:Pentatricopeptide repeat-containing protein [Thalictrum thalictroides]
MTIYRLFVQSFRRSTSICHFSTTTTTTNFLENLTAASTIPSPSTPTAAEICAEARRKKKRDNRIQPPLHALQRDPNTPRPPGDPRLPDSTSNLVGPRLNLHNRVQALIRGGDLDAASVTARQAIFSKCRPTVFTCNAVIASMYRAGRYEDAVKLFQYFFNQYNIVPNIVSYNNLINTYCDTGYVDVALDVYRHILDNAPFSPSHVSYKHLTKGLIDANRLSDAVDLLREMLDRGHGADSHVYNNIISGFLNHGNLERANELFDELRERCVVYDGVVNATFMDWFFKKGMDKEAMESYQDYLDRKYNMIPATGNVLLEVLLRHGKSTEANALFVSMLNRHKTPNFHAVNSETYNIMVNECFQLGKVSEALAVFRQIGTEPGSKPFHMDGAGYNNLLGKLCGNGLVEEAEKLFEEMHVKSVILDYNTYRFIIEAYFKGERVDDALKLFTKFVFQSNIKANPRFFNMVFGELLNNGKIEEATGVLAAMGDREVRPDPTTYELVISKLCKEGRHDHARDLLVQMVRNRIGVTPALRSSVDEAFNKEGRIDEIERILGRPHHARQGSFAHAPPSATAFARASPSPPPEFSRPAPSPPADFSRSPTAFAQSSAGTHQPPSAMGFAHQPPSAMGFAHQPPSPAEFTHQAPSPAGFAHQPPSPAGFAHSPPSPAGYACSSPSPSGFAHQPLSSAGFGHPPPSPAGFSLPLPSPAGFSHPPPSPVGFAHPPPSPVGFAHPPPSPAGFSHPPPSPVGFAHPPPSPVGFAHPPPSPVGFAHPPPSPVGFAHPPPSTTAYFHPSQSATASTYAPPAALRRVP